MKFSLASIRNSFFLLSVLIITAFVANSNLDFLSSNRVLLGLLIGMIFTVLVALLGKLFERVQLRLFNLATLGIFCGYLMGQALLLIYSNVVDTMAIAIDPTTNGLIHTLVLLATIYVSTLLTARSAEEIAFSIPFVQFTHEAKKKRDILLDSSVLLDSRIIDVVASGLIDHYVVIPRFTLHELHMQCESEDETIKSKAKRSLEVVRKMECMPALGLRVTDSDPSDCKDSTAKLIRTARILEANILTADISRIQQSEIEGVRVINIHTLANSLRPVTQAGEYIHIKIQRYGKEPRQGVGYLEDGTMVVINGGAEFIGDTIRARVLSVKHTCSGRMIFCNTTEEWSNDSQEESPALSEAASKKYFSV